MKLLNTKAESLILIIYKAEGNDQILLKQKDFALAVF